MAGMSTWKLLEFGQDLPRLLIKTRLDHDGYDIQLTDLSCIWSESLGHEAIVKRAAEGGCSIDPSEDDQYHILLVKIGAAISGDAGTTIELRLGENRRNMLNLDISAPLPGSLPTLKWSIRLAKRRQSDIAEELVKPLLQQANHLRHQVQFLVDEVKAKDRVIAKITDRLESSGSDLTTVFPGVSNIKTNRKRSQREQLASHVIGLADFDEKAWRASTAPRIDRWEASPNLLDDLLLYLPAPESSDSNGNANGEWWKCLSSGRFRHKARDANNGIQSIEKSKSARPHLSLERSKDDDEFQKQETSGHLPHDNMSEAPQDDATITLIATTDGETEDDDGIGAVPSNISSSHTSGHSQQEIRQKSALQPSSPSLEARSQHENDSSSAPSKRKVKLGTIRGKTRKAAFPELSQVQLQRAEDLDASGSEKGSATPETEDEDCTISPPKPKSKLGAFGGKTKESSRSDRLQSAQLQPAPGKSKHKLGTFGGKGQTLLQRGIASEREDSTALSAAEDRLKHVRGRASARTTESPSPSAQKVEKRPEEAEAEETAEERANRKRERLKKDIQEKHPVKKKRKF